MKIFFNILIVFLLLMNQLFAQQILTKSVAVIQVKNIEIFKALELIIDFEKDNVYGSISDDKCYFIDWYLRPLNFQNSDTVITFTSIYRSDFYKILSDSLYGVFYFKNHIIFVKKELVTTFSKTFDLLNVIFSNDNDFYIDDSQTKWIFELKNNKLYPINSFGILFINNYGSKIQYIEEIPEEIPKNK
jgi:hypothetical protein